MTRNSTNRSRCVACTFRAVHRKTLLSESLGYVVFILAFSKLKCDCVSFGGLLAMRFLTVYISATMVAPALRSIGNAPVSVRCCLGKHHRMITWVICTFPMDDSLDIADLVGILQGSVLIVGRSNLSMRTCLPGIIPCTPCGFLGSEVAMVWIVVCRPGLVGGDLPGDHP